MFPCVFIVILNWNNAPDTLECLASLERLDYPNYHIVVVDNGSEDGSPERIRAHYPEVDLLALGQNLGYGAGNNAGIQYALNRGADYVLLLNNDVTVDRVALKFMLELPEANPDCGIVGPLVYCTETDNLIFSAGGRISWYAALAYHRYMFRASHFYTRVEPEAVHFIAGCAMLISRKCIETVGLLNPDYFLNLEDVEWCVRARRKGLETWVVPTARIWHKVSATLGKSSPMNAYYMTRNTLHFFWQNAPAALRSWCVFRILIRTARTLAAWSWKRRYRSHKFQCLRQVTLLGVRDFLRKRCGQMPPDVARICHET